MSTPISGSSRRSGGIGSGGGVQQLQYWVRSRSTLSLLLLSSPDDDVNTASTSGDEMNWLPPRAMRLAISRVASERLPIPELWSIVIDYALDTKCFVARWAIRTGSAGGANAPAVIYIPSDCSCAVESHRSV